MGQAGDGARFALEATDGFGLIEPAGVQHLQRHPSFQIGIIAQVDDAEPALSQLALDAIRPELRRRGTRPSRWPVGQGGRVAEEMIDGRQGDAELRMPGEQFLTVHGPARLKGVEGGVQRRRRFRVQRHGVRSIRSRKLCHNNRPIRAKKNTIGPAIREKSGRSSLSGLSFMGGSAATMSPPKP